MAKNTKKTKMTMLEPKTAPVTNAVSAPAAGFRCRDCGSHNCSELSELPSSDFHGYQGDGSPYTSVERTRVKCECGSVSVLIKYVYVASDWKE